MVVQVTYQQSWSTSRYFHKYYSPIEYQLLLLSSFKNILIAENSHIFHIRCTLLIYIKIAFPCVVVKE